MQLLYVQRSGNGPVVILLHGLFSSSRIWKRVSRYLQGTHTVLAMDLLGFGKSPKPSLPYSLLNHLEALDTTIIAERIHPPFILAGQSIGGLLFLAYTIKYPTRVKRLVLISPPLYTSREQAGRQIKTYAGLWYFFSEGVLGYLSHGIEQLLKPLLIAILPRLTSSIKKEYFTDFFNHTWKSYSGTMQHLIYSAVFYEMAEKISIPTIILYGTGDPFIIEHNLQALARTNTYITLIPIDKKHRFISEYSELISQIVLRS